MRNKTTNIYTEWLPLIETLPNEDAGSIFKNILIYQNGGDVEYNHPIWLFIKNKIDEYNKDKRNKSNKRAEAGRLGGLAKASNAKQDVAKASNSSIKENKTKENKTKKDIFIYSKEDYIQQPLRDWLSYRKDLKDEKQWEYQYKKVKACNNPAIAVESSIGKGYKGVFDDNQYQDSKNSSQEKEYGVDYELLAKLKGDK